MGLRGEVFSSKVVCEGRTYFFNIKETRTGDLFLAIVESKPAEGESFDRRSIVVFRENLQEFMQSFTKAIAVMDKSPPPRKRSPRTAQPAAEGEAAPRKPRVIRPRREEVAEGDSPAVHAEKAAQANKSAAASQSGRRLTARKKPST